jgi:tRNA-guanine transglycosylase
VGTKGTIKGLTQGQIGELKIQISFVNTYHLVTHPGVEVLEKAGGIHQLAKYSTPLMSDSGGFQVFSLAERERIDDKSQNRRVADVRGDEKPLVEKISEDGVMFRSIYDGQLINFTPETSMDFQKAIGADINMAFDECTYHPATHAYTEKSMERTHRWLERCIKHRDTYRTRNQYLYGIIQGGTFEDLRKKSAEFVVAQNTPGVAIGGVSVGETKEEMRRQVEWVAPYLPQDRPVHLLGVGQVDDIVDLVKSGIDTFDCVEPTRVARMGSVYQTKAVLGHLNSPGGEYEIDISKSSYKADLSPVDADCECSTCVNYSKAYLYHLFKQRELLGYTLLSYHNLYVMERLMENLRGLIGQNRI